jgi:hypothetical protein
MTNRRMRLTAKVAQRERAAQRAAERAARKPEPWTPDYHLHERLRDDGGAMYEIVALPAGDQRYHRVVVQKLSEGGPPEAPVQRLATAHGVMLGPDRWARRLPKEVARG